MALSGCEVCDLHDRPLPVAGGTSLDGFRDLHRALHDWWRVNVRTVLALFGSCVPNPAGGN